MAKKAEAGIGTLILLIAMILVAAVAAGVLIQTTSSLQTKALTTSAQAEGQIVTGVEFVSVYGENNGGTDNDLEQFFVQLKLAAGSEVIKIEDVVMEFVLNNDSAALTYNTEATCDTAGAASAGSSSYNMEYLINASTHIPGYLRSGDVILLCFESPRAVIEDEKVEVNFIPRTGRITQLDTKSPSIITTDRVYLFP